MQAICSVTRHLRLWFRKENTTPVHAEALQQESECLGIFPCKWAVKKRATLTATIPKPHGQCLAIARVASYVAEPPCTMALLSLVGSRTLYMRLQHGADARRKVICSSDWHGPLSSGFGLVCKA
jgi:hypothetical protein